jgi:hypothetical protein
MSQIGKMEPLVMIITVNIQMMSTESGSKSCLISIFSIEIPLNITTVTKMVLK